MYIFLTTPSSEPCSDITLAQHTSCQLKTVITETPQSTFSVSDFQLSNPRQQVHQDKSYTSLILSTTNLYHIVQRRDHLRRRSGPSSDREDLRELHGDTTYCACYATCCRHYTKGGHAVPYVVGTTPNAVMLCHTLSVLRHMQ